MPSPARTTQLALGTAVVALAGALIWQTQRAARAVDAANLAMQAAGHSVSASAAPIGALDVADSSDVELAAGSTSVIPTSLLDSLDILAFDVAAMPAPQVGANDGASSAVRAPQDQGDRAEPRDWGNRPWDGRDRFGHGPRAMSADLIAHCLEVADEVDATLGRQLRDARQKDAAEFDRQMKQGGFGRRLASLVELKQRDPDLYRIKLGELSQAVQIDRVARQLREAKASGSEGEAEMFEGQLRRLLQVQFAMAIKARGELLCRLEDRIAELRAEMERDALNFQNTIDTRMKVLAGESTSTPAPTTGEGQGNGLLTRPQDRSQSQ